MTRLKYHHLLISETRFFGCCVMFKRWVLNAFSNESGNCYKITWRTWRKIQTKHESINFVASRAYMIEVVLFLFRHWSHNFHWSHCVKWSHSFSSLLHQPSKCLFSNLACTDITVGISFQPFHLAYGISQEHSANFYHSSLINRTLGVIFCGVSVLTVTAIKIGRLLAVSLGLIYRLVVTLWRVRVTLVLFWLVYIRRGITNHSILSIYLIINNMGVTFSMMTSTFCYIAIYIKLRCQQAQLRA